MLHALLLIALLVSFVNLGASKMKVPVTVSTSTITQDISYWKDIVAERPTYRDGYLVLSQLERLQGNMAASRRYASIANSISDSTINTKILGVSTKTE